MAKAKTLLIKIPFPGLYESWLSHGIDREAEQTADNEAERDSERYAPELRIEAHEFADILFDVTNHSKAYARIASEYLEAFDYVASDEIGLPLSLKFESMTSPKFYNFETDRLFAFIPLKVVKALFALSKRDGHLRLTKVLLDNCTSYDGFWSHYSNDLAVWLAKPVAKWDHNELEMLLRAALGDVERSELQYALEDRIGEDFMTAHDNAVDWPKFEAKVADLRAEKEAELRADDPDYVPPPIRCDRTPDMFTGRVGS